MITITKFSSRSVSLAVALALSMVTPQMVQAQSLIDNAILAQNTISNFQQVNDGLLRGGQPSDKNLEVLAKSGVKTIIDLRMEGPGTRHEAKLATKLGLNYVNVPLGFGDPDSKDTSKVMAIFNDAKQLPIFVHCRQGADRTGMLVGMYRRTTDNWDFDETYREMRAHHFKPFLSAMKDTVRAASPSKRILSSVVAEPNRQNLTATKADGATAPAKDI